MSRLLIIPDLHEPYTKKNFLKFCRHIHTYHRCDTTVFLGDVVDLHAVSFHEKHPDSDGAGTEIRRAKAAVAKWYRAFPTAKVCIGNHDRLLHRQAAVGNVPEFVLKSFNEIWDTHGWDWRKQHVIDGVLFMHGEGCGGLHPAYNTMRKLAMSVVLGHFHTACGIKYLCNPASRLFGMDVGCGIDHRAIQFDYACHNPCKPIIACATLIDGIPQIHPMPCSKGESYGD